MEASTPLFFGRRIVPKPRWLRRVEGVIGQAIPLHPNLVSSLKLVVVLPLLLGLRQVGVLPNLPALVLPLFALFLILDYLDGIVARQQHKATSFGRVFDRLTDFSLLVPVALFACGALPCLPVALKLCLDLTLLVLFCLGRGPVENRIRTTFSYTVLLILLLVSQGWPPFAHDPLASAASTQLAVAVLWLNVAFSSFVVVTRLNLLKPRYLADALSALNLLSGVASIVAALHLRFDLCLLFLFVGVVCDGLDGAAARRWGGSRFGVFSDDIADGVSYGLAPGVALVCCVPGIAGWVLGVTYAALTISRLVYFTLRKGADDPDYFSGMPSPAGAVIALCALILFGAHPALVGLLVGFACVLMVAFDLRFRHPGRLLAAVVPSLSTRQRIVAALGLALVILATGIVCLLLGPIIPAATLLVIALGYGLHVSALRMLESVRRSWSTRQGALTNDVEVGAFQRLAAAELRVPCGPQGAPDAVAGGGFGVLASQRDRPRSPGWEDLHLGPEPGSASLAVSPETPDHSLPFATQEPTNPGSRPPPRSSHAGRVFHSPLALLPADRLAARCGLARGAVRDLQGPFVSGLLIDNRGLGCRRRQLPGFLCLDFPDSSRLWLLRLPRTRDLWLRRWMRVLLLLSCCKEEGQSCDRQDERDAHQREKKLSEARCRPCRRVADDRWRWRGELLLILVAGPHRLEKGGHRVLVMLL